MSEFIYLPGTGDVRVTTDAYLERLLERREVIPAVRKRGALTASASKLTARNSAYSKRLAQPWQLRALTYYDEIGEIRFASQFYAKLLSKVRYYPARQLEDGTTEPIESGLPVNLLHRIQDPGGGRSRLQYDYGRMMFVTGEGVLFHQLLADDEEVWRFFWKDEVRYVEELGVWERVTYEKRSYDPPQYGIAYRFWTPHPIHSDLADSPLRSVLRIAEELIVLTDSVMSTATTRMTNGITILPTELSPDPIGTPGDDDYQGDEDPENDPFLSDYIEHVTSQIENPADPRSKVSFLLRGDYEYVDRVRWMPTHDPQTDYMERELRTEAVKRLALGMDFPPEFLLGMTDANHWTARQVVYDMWRSYGTPIAERFADDLSDSYLRPALREEGFADWREVVVAYDDSEVVISPDRTEDADKALDRIAIGFEGYRKLKAIPESMAPTDEEKAFLASLKVRLPVEVEDGELIIPQRGPVPSANGNGRPEDGPPSPTGGREGSRQEARTASAQIHGAAALALHRCRDLAGVRIRHKCPDCAEGQPASLVAATLPDLASEPLRLVRGGADGFRDLLVEWSFDEAQAQSLAQQLEVFAARTLTEQRCPDLPSGFLAAIEKAKEVSHALVT